MDWNGSERRALASRAIVVGLGVCYLLVAGGWALRLLASSTPIPSVALITLLIGGPGLILSVYGGYRLPNADIRPEFYPTVAGKSLLGLGVMVGILLLYHLQPADSLEGSLQTVLILISLSTASGFGVGLNDARARSRAYEVELRNRELRRAQAQLEETVERLRASNERLEQFAYAASHDLQEPLRMVSSYLQLLERREGDRLSEDGEEFLTYAVDGADRMREMIDGLLAYSRVETQGDAFGPVDLEDVLADVEADLQMKIDERDARVTADPLPRVYGDERQLRQVFQNLLANAIEYSEERPRVHVSAERNGKADRDGEADRDSEDDGGDDEWQVSVRDEGIGIEAAEHDRIFEVFQRLHAHEEHPGTGIGLALVRLIVERHGGEIWVESEPGEGSTFFFTLPASRESAPPEVVPDAH